MLVILENPLYTPLCQISKLSILLHTFTSFPICIKFLYKNPWKKTWKIDPRAMPKVPSGLSNDVKFIS